MSAIALRCHRPDCRRPWGHIYNGVLTVESRHEGRTHTNAVSLDVLMKMLRGTRHAEDDEQLVIMLEAVGLPSVEPLLIEVHSDNGNA